jgi:transposase
MNKPANSTTHNNTTPFCATHPASHGRAASAESNTAPAADETETRSGGSTRGRKSEYSERIIEMMCEPIRRYGLSDSAAAESVGMSSTTISRWKKKYPEIVSKIQQAREACRMRQLQIVFNHAEAENGKGWRAATWILERLFPGDYSPRMQERFAYQAFEDLRRDREARALLEEDIKELHRKQDQQRDEWEKAKQAAAAAETEAANRPVATTEAAEHRASTSEGDSHNSVRPQSAHQRG